METQNKNRERLNAMRAKVNKWSAPSKDHAGLKKFMAEQIEETIRFDGNSDYYEKELAELVQKSGAIWRKEKIAACIRDIDYHSKEHRAEVDRCNERTQWVKQLRESLKQ